MHSLDNRDTTPWYKQFWPWAIIAIPATTVVACIIMITLAIKTDDGLVSGDYYREGLTINERLKPADSQ
ncbi:MAG: FixH family protein [Pseudomonadota bacterium]